MDSTIDTLRRRIERVMASDDPCSRSPAAALLTVASRAYGAAVKLRADLYRSGRLVSRQLPCRVISIGNLTVGGTGKTPMTLYLAEWLHRKGWRTAVVSRGYKGGAEKSGGIVSDGRRIRMPSAVAGDEPTLLATALLDSAVPVVVGRNRYEAGMLAVRHFRPDIVLLDDAFQHLQLARDIDLVLIDGRRPFGNGFLLPRGSLREPVSALSRGDVFVVTRIAKDSRDVVERLRSIVGKRPLYRATHVPCLARWLPAGSNGRQTPAGRQTEFDLRSLGRRKIFGFAGLADNDHFRETLERLGCDLVGFSGFADHHRYSREDVAALLQAARHAGADLVCTTEKDYVRLAQRLPWPVDLTVVGIEMALGSCRAAFEQDIIDRLSDGPEA